MHKEKKFTIALTPQDYMDITLHLEKGEITRFSLNYRGLIDNKWRPIFRVDNFHGFLHEQKLWISSRPLKIQSRLPVRTIIEEYAETISGNFRKLRKYYEEKNEE